MSNVLNPHCVGNTRSSVAAIASCSWAQSAEVIALPNVLVMAFAAFNAVSVAPVKSAHACSSASACAEKLVDGV